MKNFTGIIMLKILVKLLVDHLRYQHTEIHELPGLSKMALLICLVFFMTFVFHDTVSWFSRYRLTLCKEMSWFLFLPLTQLNSPLLLTQAYLVCFWSFSFFPFSFQQTFIPQISPPPLGFGFGNSSAVAPVYSTAHSKLRSHYSTDRHCFVGSVC